MSLPESVARFVARYPRLYHVTDPQALPGIRQHGLLSAAALLQLYGVPKERRPELLETNRGHGNFVPLERPGLPGATLRDQWMPDEELTPLLGGVYTGEPRAWRHHINRHVFFSLSEKDAVNLVRVNARRRQRILMFDAAPLLARHADKAFTAPINTGIARTRFNAGAKRDETTFRPVAETPRADRRLPKELAVADAVPDAWSYLLDAPIPAAPA